MWSWGWVVQCDIDCETNEELNDDQIIAPVFENNSEETVNEDSNRDVDESSTRISPTDTKNAFDISLQYIEQNSTSTPVGILWIKKWKNTAFKSGISSIKQKSITDFF